MTSNALLDNARTDLEKVKARNSGSDYEARITAAQTVQEIDAIEAEARDALSIAQRKFDSVSRSTEARSASALIPSGDVRVGYEQHTYERANPYVSYFADMYNSQRTGNREALARLQRGSEETRIDAERKGLILRDAEGRAMSSTTGDGGAFLPPIYYGDLFAEVKRARRVTANLYRTLPLSATGNTITVPKFDTGTTVDTQADNANVSNTDATTEVITVPVITLAGRVDVSRQVLERSSPGLDQVLAQDLANAYNSQLNSLVVNGNGSTQPLGILNVTGINTITYTDASPTVPAIYPRLLDAMRRVSEGVYEPPTAWVMTARRWAWFLAAVDDDHRPLVVPSAQGNFNSMGVQTGGGAGPFGNDSDSIKPAGTLAGISVLIDETLPKTLGSSTSQDVLFCAHFDECLLWEDSMRSFVFEGVSSATNAIRLMCVGYVAATAERFPKAISTITGTGLTAPTFS